MNVTYFSYALRENQITTATWNQYAIFSRLVEDIFSLIYPWTPVNI